ncbi:hypothetical protein [Desulfotignum phosphitoxidans]|uniref:Uncharacterized protein n=1 Tax=Desulfotignum phosphitoxidans DSM 13687 TaxID=1286635 RepID=S0G4D6_9BACT|nr:hypothetical protein [Desulfotignum phosphitoxidans]EMS79177.1 hypothetical protein Dpo_5c01000 [Desulfotignum phosphitoxidans DSM 13687]
MSNQSIQPITTPAQFFDELEKFQQAFDYHLELLNKTDTIEKSVAEGLEIRAKLLHQAAAKVLPRGKNKARILSHLTWCHKDAHSWATLFAVSQDQPENKAGLSK